MSKISKPFSNKNLPWLLLFFLCLFFLPRVSFGAEGDLIWARTKDFTEGLLGRDAADAIAVDSTGSFPGVYAAGGQGEPGKIWWRVEKRTLDGTGGSDGEGLLWAEIKNFVPGSNNVPTSISVDSTGVYVAGEQGNVWRVEKRSPIDGSLIWARTKDFTSGSDRACAIAVDSTGSFPGVYVAGEQGNVWRVEKRTLDGAGGSDGEGLIWARTKDFTSGSDRAYAIAVDSTGSFPGVYVAGRQNNEWRVEKRTLDGAGGSDGEGLLWARTKDFGSGQEVAYAIAVDSTGVYAAGAQNDNAIWRVEKRTLDGAGGSDGEGLLWARTKNLTSGRDIAYAIAVDSTGVYAAGTQNAESIWRVEKRTLDGAGGSDGEGLIWAKPEDYSPYTPSGYHLDIAYAIDVDSTGVYVAGCVSSCLAWRVEKRENGPDYIDIGLRIFDGTGVISIAAEPTGTLTSPLRIAKNGVVYGIALVNPGDPNDSGVRIQTSSGIKALRKL